MEKFNPEQHKPRALKRNEVKQLRASGLHLNYMKEAEVATKIEDFTDLILDTFYPDIDFNDAAQKECIQFATETFKLTYGAETEVKNS